MFQHDYAPCHTSRQHTTHCSARVFFSCFMFLSLNLELRWIGAEPSVRLCLSVFLSLAMEPVCQSRVLLCTWLLRTSSHSFKITSRFVHLQKMSHKCCRIQWLTLSFLCQEVRNATLGILQISTHCNFTLYDCVGDLQQMRAQVGIRTQLNEQNVCADGICSRVEEAVIHKGKQMYHQPVISISE